MKRVLIAAAVIFLSSCSGEQDPAPGIPGSIAPYPVVMPGTGNVAILWRSRPGMALLRWGAFEPLSFSREVSWGSNVLTGTVLSNCSPDVLYSFAFSGSNINDSGSFSVPGSAASNCRVFVFGDSRTGTDILNTLCGMMDAVMQTNSGVPYYAVHTGDLVTDGDSDDSWENEFFNRDMASLRSLISGVPLFAVPGNHEASRVLFSGYFPYGFQDNYGEVRIGPAAFYLVNQYVAYSPGSAQHGWLSNALASGDAPWKIIVLHDSGWNAGSHENNPQVQDYIHPLCLGNGVQMVLAGHNHNYARADVDGVQYLTLGGGGGPLHPVDLTRPYVVKAVSVHHFGYLTATSNTLSVSVTALSGSGVDSFQLSR